MFHETGLPTWVLENPHGNIHIFQIKVKTSTGYSISNRLHGDNKETIKKMSHGLYAETYPAASWHQLFYISAAVFRDRQMPWKNRALLGGIKVDGKLDIEHFAKADGHIGVSAEIKVQFESIGMG